MPRYHGNTRVTEATASVYIMAANGRSADA